MHMMASLAFSCPTMWTNPYLCWKLHLQHKTIYYKNVLQYKLLATNHWVNGNFNRKYSNKSPESISLEFISVLFLVSEISQIDRHFSRINVQSKLKPDLVTVPYFSNSKRRSSASYVSGSGSPATKILTALRLSSRVKKLCKATLIWLPLKNFLLSPRDALTASAAVDIHCKARFFPKVLNAVI